MSDVQLVAAAITPKIEVANLIANCQEIELCARQCKEQIGAQLIVFPELALTGATAADLFNQKLLISSAEKYISELAQQLAHLDALLVFGAPVVCDKQLYDCAIALYKGELLGIIPAAVPFDGHFAPAASEQSFIDFAEQHHIPFGTDVLISCPALGDATLGVVVGRDFAPVKSATLYAHLTVSPAQAGQAAYVREAYMRASATANTSIVVASAGPSESSTDYVFSGERLIASCGKLTASSEKLSEGVSSASLTLKPTSEEPPHFELAQKQDGALNPFPFIPTDEVALDDFFEDVLSIQAKGLARRLEHTGSKRALLGVSGGLDSTLALLVTVRAFDYLSLDRAGILAITMPGFGTTSRTKSNAELLSEALACDFRTIDITAAVSQHLHDLDHDTDARDTVFENAQARERTQILMDLSNKEGGLVVGTGDMSELALGWATYNGDHMSMYGVNAGIPKTLIRRLVAYEANRLKAPVQDILLDVLDTPVSPELLPAESDGSIAQKTEDLIGPYELHDFFLWWTLTDGTQPKDLLELALEAWGNTYDEETILKWLVVFYKRFFSQQFKRSCSPDGVAPLGVSLSPRAGLAMPSDASSLLWLSSLT